MNNSVKEDANYVDKILRGLAPCHAPTKSYLEVVYGLRAALIFANDLPQGSALTGWLCEVANLIWDYENLRLSASQPKEATTGDEKEPMEDDFERYPLPICFDPTEEQGQLHLRSLRIKIDHEQWKSKQTPTTIKKDNVKYLIENEKEEWYYPSLEMWEHSSVNGMKTRNCMWVKNANEARQFDSFEKAKEAMELADDIHTPCKVTEHVFSSPPTEKSSAKESGTDKGKEDEIWKLLAAVIEAGNNSTIVNWVKANFTPNKSRTLLDDRTIRLIDRLNELKKYHISPYNLGDEGEMSEIIDKLFHTRNTAPAASTDKGAGESIQPTDMYMGEQYYGCARDKFYKNKDMTNTEKKQPSFGVNDEVYIIDTEIYDKPTWIHGKVKEVGEETISVKWDDLDDPTEYELSNLPDIRFTKPTDKGNEAKRFTIQEIKQSYALHLGYKDTEDLKAGEQLETSDARVFDWLLSDRSVL